jgi:hypothetical protein
VDGEPRKLRAVSSGEDDVNNPATFQLAGDAHALAVKFGALLIKSEKLCGEGAAWDSKELTRLAGEISTVNGMLDSLYYCAKTILDEADFEKFCQLSKIDRSLIEDGVIRAREEFTACHYELSQN